MANESTISPTESSKQVLKLAISSDRIKVNVKIISPEYFELILNTPYYQREIEKMKSGISDSGLNLTQAKFLKIEIPIPSLKE